MIPSDAPFSAEQLAALEPLLEGMSVAQRAWLGGYLSRKETRFSAGGAGISQRPLVVLFGTESGNSEKLAEMTFKDARRHGRAGKVISMADVELADLTGDVDLLVIVSTWGDGEPPQSAIPFFKLLAAGGADFARVRYSVCALGDSSYDKFCESGKWIDARLEQLGARRVVERRDCDLDFGDPYSEWAEAALAAMRDDGDGQPEPADVGGGLPSVTYDKSNPYPAELCERVLLSGRGSAKETWHFEFSLAGSGISYEPGDALAVGPRNSPDMVNAVLAAAGLEGSETVKTRGGETKPLALALRDDYDITALSRAVLGKLREISGSVELAALLAEEENDRLKGWIGERQIIDALETFLPGKVEAERLVGIFRKLPPRLYSIASSPLAHPDEVHLTVAAVRYNTLGRQRQGVASTWLADLVDKGERVPVYVHSNKNFRLPADPDTPVIMIGPGTGVAPFRAFVEHRAALGAKGRNWLFFGDRNYTYDFLYQTEWQEHLRGGTLTRLDVAFSRDQPEKIYVQHRMAERSRELYAWLRDGAHIYVCGDATRMAADVNEELVAIHRREGGLTREAAEAEIDVLRKSGRYHRDVY